MGTHGHPHKVPQQQQAPPLYSSIASGDHENAAEGKASQQHIYVTRTTTTTTTLVMDERQSLLPMHHSASSGSISAASPPPPKSVIETASSSSPWYCCSLRRWALELSLYLNLIICLAKLVAYLKSLSLSVLAALVDSFLDVVSQLVLYYTERHSSFQRRSSAMYPAGAARMEPIGVLTCAALMGMASFEVIKESVQRLIYFDAKDEADQILNYNMASVWSMIIIVVVKLGLLLLCQRASRARVDVILAGATNIDNQAGTLTTATNDSELPDGIDDDNTNDNSTQKKAERSAPSYSFMSDPTLEALAQDHLNDTLSNGIAALALILALQSNSLWFLDPVGAILISVYIIHSWYHTGKEQIEQLTGRGAPDEFIDELLEIANSFDDRMVVDVCRAYHFGPKFLVELEVVLPKDTLLFESHDLGMELQYEIEGRPEVERCFVHIDYEQRPYDEHVVSKVPELREKYKQRGATTRSTRSL